MLVSSEKNVEISNFILWSCCNNSGLIVLSEVGSETERPPLYSGIRGRELAPFCPPVLWEGTGCGLQCLGRVISLQALSSGIVSVGWLFIRMSQLSYFETFQRLLRFKIRDRLLFLRGKRKGISIYWSTWCLSLYAPSHFVLNTALRGRFPKGCVTCSGLHSF